MESRKISSLGFSILKDIVLHTLVVSTASQRWHVQIVNHLFSSQETISLHFLPVRIMGNEKGFTFIPSSKSSHSIDNHILFILLSNYLSNPSSYFSSYDYFLVWASFFPLIIPMTPLQVFPPPVSFGDTFQYIFSHYIAWVILINVLHLPLIKKLFKNLFA